MMIGEKNSRTGYFSFRSQPSTARRFRAVSQRVGINPSALANMLVIDFVNHQLLTLPGSRSDHLCRENQELDKMFGRAIALDIHQKMKFADPVERVSEE